MGQTTSGFIGTRETCRNRNSTVLVVGAGHVGLTHACFYAESGIKVVLWDESAEVLTKISRGESPFYEPMIEELLKKHLGRNLSVAQHLSESVIQSDILSVSVGTPLNPLDEPDVAAVFRACVNVAGHAREGTLLMLTSTVPVGTTSHLCRELHKRGIKVGERLGVSYCPERMVTGDGIRTMREFPRMVSGIDVKSVKAAEHFFQSIGVKVVVVSSPEVAEMAKLLCNAQRAADIALANEFALACSAYGLDWTEVFRAANTSPLVDVMGPGIMGGSCLTKDPDFIIHGVLEKGVVLKVSMAARELNRSLPSHVAKLVRQAMERALREISQSKVAVLGLAFKGNTGDIRETPVLPIISLLNKMGFERICVYDPYVSTEDVESTGLEFDLVRDMKLAVQDAACIILAADHPQIANADLAEICRHAVQPPILIDAKGILTTRIGGAFQGGIGLPLR